MILQSLVNYYDAFARRNNICPPGWSNAKVSYALQLRWDGTLANVIPLKERSADGKKEVPGIRRVPAQILRSSGIAANFLCENSSYFLGIDNKGRPERSIKCFEEAKHHHQEILKNVQSDGEKSAGVKAVLSYFENWKPEAAKECEALQPYLEDILKGANMIFKLPDGHFAEEDEKIKAAWEDFYGKSDSDARIMRCLVTGKTAPVVRLHPSIKGIRDAQPTGASLVSFNAAALESYGHEMSDNTGQGLNAPVSEEAAFKYGAALNYLTADREHVQTIADMTVVYWAETAEPVCQDIFAGAAFGARNQIKDADLSSIVEALSKGNSIEFNKVPINPENRFYVLGLSPNAARLSVRFFYQGEFGAMLKNLRQHYENLNIIKPPQETRMIIPFWSLLNETANQNTKDKIPNPPMAGAVLRSVLEGTSYPEALFDNTMIRIRAEHDINWRKAAIIKAYFLKNVNFADAEKIKEAAKVELNETSEYMPYVLGRIFAVLEKIQTAAAWQSSHSQLKTTIKDRYFGSASATPGTVFPQLLRLSQHHQKKLMGGSRKFYDDLIQDLEGRIHETLPARLSLQEQGAFYLGYYHEKQKLFAKAENKEDETNE